MSALSHRAPPEIEPGVTLDDLRTLEEAEAALDRLMMAVASIEQQISRHRASPNQPADWRVRAEKALRVKRFMIPRVQQRRADLARQAKADQHAAAQHANRSRVEEKRRLMVRTAWDREPDAMQRVEAVVREQRPELFDGGEEGCR